MNYTRTVASFSLTGFFFVASCGTAVSDGNPDAGTATGGSAGAGARSADSSASGGVSGLGTGGAAGAVSAGGAMSFDGGLQCEMRMAAAFGGCSGGGASPFACMRFNADCSIDVRLESNGPWYRWEALDGICVDSIVAAALFACDDGATQWKKRLAEDLGDVLAKLGATLGATAGIGVRDLQTGNQLIITVDATITKRQLTYDCWQLNDSCLGSPALDGGSPPGDGGGSIPTFPPDLCGDVCRHIYESCPDYYDVGCVSRCLSDESSAIASGLGSRWTNLINCCISRPFTLAKCASEGVGAVGVEDCDDSEICPEFALGGTPPPSLDAGDPFDGGRPAFPADECGLVCEHLFDSCPTQFYDPGCVGVCIAERDRATQRGRAAEFQVFATCCETAPFPANKCSMEGIGAVGFEDCDDPEICPAEGSAIQ